jgi:hypothetical protein
MLRQLKWTGDSLLGRGLAGFLVAVLTPIPFWDAKSRISARPPLLPTGFAGTLFAFSRRSIAPLFASLIALGTRVHYHTTSRQRLADVTADALRGAAARLPPDDLRQLGTWVVCGHLQLTSDARAIHPPVMGGSGRDVRYEASSASLRTLRHRHAGPRRYPAGKNSCPSLHTE